MGEIKTQHDGSICGARPGSGPPFGRKVAGCPRCDELLAGAPVRELSGHRAAGIERAAQDQRDRQDFPARLAAHRAACSTCSTGRGVCTYGDW